MKKKLLLISLLFIFYINVPVSAYAEVISDSDLVTQTIGSQINPLKDDTVWYYRAINGKLYRRLYNKSTGQWIGNWELVP